MSVVEFMMRVDWRGDIRDASILKIAKLIDAPPIGIHRGRWRGMVFWMITRLVLKDGMRL